MKLVYSLMTWEDIPRVEAIESSATLFPWGTRQFQECLEADYQCIICRGQDEIIGFAVVSVVLDEASLLNFCIAPAHQGQGHGRAFLRHIVKSAIGAGIKQIFLEVRPSNGRAISLYESEGFRFLNRRRNYYPSHGGREDALVYLYQVGPRNPAGLLLPELTSP